MQISFYLTFLINNLRRIGGCKWDCLWRKLGTHPMKQHYTLSHVLNCVCVWFMLVSFELQILKLVTHFYSRTLSSFSFYITICVLLNKTFYCLGGRNLLFNICRPLIWVWRRTQFQTQSQILFTLQFTNSTKWNQGPFHKGLQLIVRWISIVVQWQIV